MKWLNLQILQEMKRMIMYLSLTMGLHMTLNLFTKLHIKVFGHKNVNVLLHMNRMIELRIQIHTGFQVSSVFLRILISLSIYH